MYYGMLLLPNSVMWSTWYLWLIRRRLRPRPDRP